MTEKRKLLFLVNAHAGKEAIRNPFLTIVDTFIKAGYELTVYMTQRGGELPDIVRQQAEEYDLLVCSGGDGTLNETINGLMECQHPPMLGYIPAGTTNDFAASLCLPKNMAKAAEVAVSGAPLAFDVGRFNHRYFAYVAAFGAFTDVAYSTSQDVKNSLGKLAYLLEGARRLTTLQSYQIHMEHDGGTIDDEILVGVVSNSSYVAGLPMGKINDASMTDGLLEVILVKKPAMMIELTGVINGLLMGQLDSDLVYTLKTSKLKLQSEKPIPWTLDGEYGGDCTQVEIVNNPRALTVNVPPESLLPQKKKR